jgi:hypothetical protein
MGIRDAGRKKLGSRIRDPGSGINIPDPQHCDKGKVSNCQIDRRNTKREGREVFNNNNNNNNNRKQQ